VYLSALSATTVSKIESIIKAHRSEPVLFHQACLPGVWINGRAINVCATST